MTELPDDIKNYICDFAVDDTKIWRPFFSPTTGKFSWKVNRDCLKYIELSRNFIRLFKTITRLDLHRPREDVSQCYICELSLAMTYIAEVVCVKFTLNDDKYVARFVRNRKDTKTDMEGYLYKNDNIHGYITKSIIKWNPYIKSEPYDVSYVYLVSMTDFGVLAALCRRK